MVRSPCHHPPPSTPSHHPPPSTLHPFPQPSTPVTTVRSLGRSCHPRGQLPEPEKAFKKKDGFQDHT